MIRIFLADDEPWVLLGLKGMIDWGEAGFEICGEAMDGVKAWERISRLKPDLVLSDIRMPGLTGIELVKRIREERMEAEVIFMSGYSEFEYARAGLQYGCVDYLLKPVYEEDLRSCLAKAAQRIEEARSRRAAEAQQPAGDDEEGGRRRMSGSTERRRQQDGSGTAGVQEMRQEDQMYRSEAGLAREMVQYMREHYRDVTQQQLAERFCLSGSAVSQIIKRHTGKNYSEHLLDIRIRKAQELLRATNESIERVAELAGYNDYFYFTKVFKKATGLSPSAYRRSL